MKTKTLDTTSSKLPNTVERAHKLRTLLDLGRSPTSQAAASVDFKPVRGKLVLRDMDFGIVVCQT